jgi:hypothetical protein
MIATHRNEIAKRRAAFTDILSAKTDNKLTAIELQTISENYYLPHNDRHSAFTPEIDIIVHEDIRDFTHSATLKRVVSIDKYQTADAVDETGTWLLGDGVFGIWFDNNLRGNPIEANVYNMPVLDFNQLQVNIIQRYSSKYRHMKPIHSETSWTLNVWLSKAVQFRSSSQ